MLNPDTCKSTGLIDEIPTLMVLIDTEENFDWSKPLARENTDVTAMRAQVKAHRIFDKFGIKPVYVADYPVVSQNDGVQPLRELFDDGKCVIGAHLHPWVNPPFDEVVCNINSYPGNLPAVLEREKLRCLTETIGEQFGERPVVYKAGRYGVGFNTSSILDELGYEIDTSVLSRTDLSDEDGPNFSHCSGDPYWFGTNRRLLEIPMTAGYVGALRGAGPYLRQFLTSSPSQALHLSGIFSRLGLFERIVLTPEGITWQEHQRLTHALHKAGQRVFSFTYHSPSLALGYTPYVQSERDLAGFLDKFERYFDFFFGELGGRAATPTEIRAHLTNEQTADTPDGLEYADHPVLKNV
jgi:hypothetical protein